MKRGVKMLEFGVIREQTVHIGLEREKQQVIEFLKEQGLSYDQDIEYTVILLDKDKIVGTGSFSGKILKCIALDSEYKNMGLSNRIVTHLIQEQYQRGNTHLFLYTKPEHLTLFSQLGFYKISEVSDKVLLMENKSDGISKYLQELSQYKRSGQVISSIVMNCNPFTLGHQHLIKRAAAQSDAVHIFIVWEDKSVFPSEIRYQLVKKGTKHLPNVFIHKGKDYIISNATFPSYFLKEYQDIVETHALLDLQIFCQYIAPELGINRRYVGEEPYCVVTKAYNLTMQHMLPQNNIQVVEIPRFSVEDSAVSASKIRSLIREGDLSAVKQFVPQTTYDYLLSDDAKEIIQNIRFSNNRH